MKTETNSKESKTNVVQIESSIKSMKSLRPMKSMVRVKSLRPEQTAVVAKIRRSQIRLS